MGPRHVRHDHLGRLRPDRDEPDAAELAGLVRGAAGLVRPRLFASLARAQTEGNQFAEAFHSAAKALDLDGKDRYAWNALTRAAFNVEKKLPKGEEVVIEFTADQAGTFPFQCSVFCGLGHKKMKGELIVE